MENASKALLIAGAILIAILIIGIGMMVFNGIGSITGQQEAKVDAMAIQMFNAEFEGYRGTNVSGANVKALINSINASNASYANDESRQITAKDGSVVTGTTWSKGNPVKLTGTIGSNYRYIVDFETESGSGFINKVSITKK